MLFTGTSIVRGKGRALVVATGKSTELGKLSTLLSESEQQKTPLEERLDHFGQRILIACIAISAIMFGWGLYRGQSTWQELLLAAESTAHPCGEHPDLLGGQIEDVTDLVSNEERHLAGGAENQPPVGVQPAAGGMGLERSVIDPLGAPFTGHHRGRRRERGLHIPGFAVHLSDRVALGRGNPRVYALFGMQQRRAR